MRRRGARSPVTHPPHPSLSLLASSPAREGSLGSDALSAKEGRQPVPVTEFRLVGSASARAEPAWPELGGGGHQEQAMGQTLGTSAQQMGVYSVKTHKAVGRSDKSQEGCKVP